LTLISKTLYQKVIVHACSCKIKGSENCNITMNPILQILQKTRHKLPFLDAPSLAIADVTKSPARVCQRVVYTCAHQNKISVISFLLSKLCQLKSNLCFTCDLFISKYFQLFLVYVSASLLRAFEMSLLLESKLQQFQLVVCQSF